MELPAKFWKLSVSRSRVGNFDLAYAPKMSSRRSKWKLWLEMETFLDTSLLSNTDGNYVVNWKAMSVNWKESCVPWPQTTSASDTKIHTFRRFVSPIAWRGGARPNRSSIRLPRSFRSPKPSHAAHPTRARGGTPAHRRA